MKEIAEAFGMKTEFEAVVLGADSPGAALARARSDLLRIELSIGSGPFEAAALPVLNVWSAIASAHPGGIFLKGICRARRMMELILEEALPDGLDPKAREALRLGRLAGALILGLASLSEAFLEHEIRELSDDAGEGSAFDPARDVLLEFLLSRASRGRQVVALPRKKSNKAARSVREFILGRLTHEPAASLLREAIPGGLLPGLRAAAFGLPAVGDEEKRFERILMKALVEEERSKDARVRRSASDSREMAELTSRALLLAVREPQLLILTRENDGADVVEEKAKASRPPRLWVAADGIFLEWPKTSRTIEAVLRDAFRLPLFNDSAEILSGLIRSGLIDKAWQQGPKEAELPHETASVVGLAESAELLAALIAAVDEGGTHEFAQALERPEVRESRLSRLDWRLFPRDPRAVGGAGSSFVGPEGRRAPTFFWSLALPDHVPLPLREILEGAEKRLSQRVKSEARASSQGLFLGEEFFGSGELEAAADLASGLGICAERRSALHGGALRRMRGLGPNAGKHEIGIVLSDACARPHYLWSDGTVTDAQRPKALWVPEDE